MGSILDASGSALEERSAALTEKLRWLSGHCASQLWRLRRKIEAIPPWRHFASRGVPRHLNAAPFYIW